ncbi:Arf-GAP with coiled-coil, ANK repeat and PH domain-containing protein 3 [Labeo rohita]|uniref:Arf-GAP with coiled-coil, ANK repeat and PH domain-containing protein 3 n=1 Tax=Labeo rohita TaxID=84645 RepID=A0ABQ8LFP5_LABRO|nr:Arf-GAP with coiled-coil, ANK repeat and PH domain-containing protein 3 [Labeo rohita]
MVTGPGATCASILGVPCAVSRHDDGANIDEVETEVVEIEAKLDKLVKLCGGMIEAGKAYVTANKLFINGIRDLSQQCKKDQMISDCLEKCGESLQEIVNYHMVRLVFFSFVSPHE